MFHSSELEQGVGFSPEISSVVPVLDNFEGSLLGSLYRELENISLEGSVVVQNIPIPETSPSLLDTVSGIENVINSLVPSCKEVLKKILLSLFNVGVRKFNSETDSQMGGGSKPSKGSDEKSLQIGKGGKNM